MDPETGYVAAWLASFRQTFEACSRIAWGVVDNEDASPKVAPPINFAGSPLIDSVHSGAGAGLKSALLSTDDAGQSRILEKIKDLMDGFGLDSVKVLAHAAEDISGRVGKAFAELTERIRRTGTAIKRQHAKPVLRACAMAIVASALLAGNAEAARANDKIRDDLLQIASRTVEQTATSETIAKLRRDVYNLFDYVEKNHFKDRIALSENERDAFARPLTVMLALRGDKETALVVQLLANPADERIFDWCEDRGINPFELVQRVADIANGESAYTNLAVQAARYMYGEEDAALVFERVMEQMERSLNTERASVLSFSAPTAGGVVRGV